MTFVDQEMFLIGNENGIDPSLYPPVEMEMATKPAAPKPPVLARIPRRDLFEALEEMSGR